MFLTPCWSPCPTDIAYVNSHELNSSVGPQLVPRTLNKYNSTQYKAMLCKAQQLKKLLMQHCLTDMRHDHAVSEHAKSAGRANTFTKRILKTDSGT